MKKAFRPMSGVTLLEIMLVLAIAAMIIVMSIRYYQSTNDAQKANTAVTQIMAIVGAADGIALPAGTYEKITPTYLKELLPKNAFITPWQTEMQVSGTKTALTITLLTAPIGICKLIVSKLETDNHFNAGSASCNGGNVVLTYQANASGT